MLRMNKASRFDIAALAISHVAAQNPQGKIAPKAHVLEAGWKHKLVEHAKYVVKYGDDPEWCALSGFEEEDAKK